MEHFILLDNGAVDDLMTLIYDDSGHVHVHVHVWGQYYTCHIAYMYLQYNRSRNNYNNIMRVLWNWQNYCGMCDCVAVDLWCDWWRCSHCWCFARRCHHHLLLLLLQKEKVNRSGERGGERERERKGEGERGEGWRWVFVKSDHHVSFVILLGASCGLAIKPS